MKDRIYKTNTKSTFKNIQSWLLSRGYKLESYGDVSDDIGESYFIKPGVMLKAVYQWKPNPNGRGVVSGKMISLEDMTSCYSTILGKATGYR